MGLCGCGERGGGRAPLAPRAWVGVAGEGRREGMERDTESLGPCWEVVRGILGDRFKVGVCGGCSGGGGEWWWFLLWVVGFCLVVVKGEEGGG